MSYRLGYAPLSEHPEHWSLKVAGRQSRALPYLGLASALGYLPQTFQDQASRYSLYGGIRQPVFDLPCPNSIQVLEASVVSRSVYYFIGAKFTTIESREFQI